MITRPVLIRALTSALLAERHPGGRTCRQTAVRWLAWCLVTAAAIAYAAAGRDRRHADQLAEAAQLHPGAEQLADLARRSSGAGWRRAARDLRNGGTIAP